MSLTQEPWALQSTSLRSTNFSTRRDLDAIGRLGQEPVESTPVPAEESSSTPTGRRSSTFTPEQGREAAQALLNQQGMFNQFGIQFSQSRPPVELSPVGQRRATLNGMTKMGETLYQQHTGGRTGESYSREQLGEMLNALKRTSPPGPQAFAVPRMNSPLQVMWQMQSPPETPLLNSVA